MSGRVSRKRIASEEYFWHISRYIHLNAMDITDSYVTYPYSSIDYFLGNKHASWLHPESIVETEEERQKYVEFLADYESVHDELKELKSLLAHA
jgi:hypothetical protein